jgi:putative DNA methylase
VLTPKNPELVATQYRFDNDKELAKQHFLNGFIKAFSRMQEHIDKNYPLTVFYAFKQNEEDESEDSNGSTNVTSTGWETMLESLLESHFSIEGTWPFRTEMKTRQVAMGSNALASSIVLVCRPKSIDSPMATKREFISAMKQELPSALKKLQEENIAPVDLAQASIGPGIAIFSRYSKILESDGTSLSVRDALQLINQELGSFLKKNEGDMDQETQFLIDWFEQYGLDQGQFGLADILSKAKNTSIDGLSKSGLLTSKSGKVTITNRDDYPKDWNPGSESRLILWMCTQYLIKRHNEEGEDSVAKLVSQIGTGKSEDAKNLAYRLFNICERKGWINEAIAYNELVTAWPQIIEKAANLSGKGPQKKLDI